MTPRHANISVFVPHIGCPNKCSFCDQRHITGSHRAPDSNDVIEAVNTAVKGRNYDPLNTEIAFFGGSFTAINREYMKGLLEAAYSFVKSGDVKGIRISTRPDAIDDEILTLLKQYGVTSIELGAQSLNDKVLRMNNRGHSAKDVKKASELIKSHGFSLGLQMMTGLYGDNDEYALHTAKQIIALTPDTVRIYPTVVLKDTDLAALYADGKYYPQTLDGAVELSCKLLSLFDEAGINVIRLGLHSIEPDSYVAGPWHPAFCELCLSRMLYYKARAELKEKGKYILYVNPTCVSRMVGQKRSNIEALKSDGFECKVVEDCSVAKNSIKAERI